MIEKKKKSQSVILRTNPVIFRTDPVLFRTFRTPLDKNLETNGQKRTEAVRNGQKKTETERNTQHF